VTAEWIIRLAVDINVFITDILSQRRGRRGFAATAVVEAVRHGTCPAGPVQLITSLPIIENFANVLRRKLDYDAQAADQKAWLLEAIALEGPAPSRPLLTVGAGYIPFETEAQLRQSIAAQLRQPDADKLFDEIRDDRYVLETALAGRADILVTCNVADFARGPAIQFQRTDFVLFPFADRKLVIGTPSFAIHWLRQGIVPDAAFIADRPDAFARQSMPRT